MELGAVKVGFLVSKSLVLSCWLSEAAAAAFFAIPFPFFCLVSRHATHHPSLNHLFSFLLI